MESLRPRSLTRVLASSVSGGSRTKGRLYALEGAVVEIDGTAWSADARVKGSELYHVRIERDDDSFTAQCTCRFFRDRGEICKHIWATLIEAERRDYLAGDGTLGEESRIQPSDAGDEAADPEYAPSRPARGRPPGPRPWEKFLRDFSAAIERSETGARPPKFADAEIVYAIDRSSTLSSDALALDLLSRQRKRNGEWGKPKPAGVATRDVEYMPDALDREVIPLLLGASDEYAGIYTSDYGRASFRLTGPILQRVLPLIARSGRLFLRIRRQPTDELIAYAWDDGQPWVFRLDIAHPSGTEEFSIDGVLVRGDERLRIREPAMILPSGYVFHRGLVARLDARGAFPWIAQLRGTGPITIPPNATGELVDVLARSGIDPADLPDELRFEIVAEAPQPSITIRAEGQAAAGAPLAAAVAFNYGGLAVPPGPGATVFDTDRRRLVRRDLAFEDAALKRLAQVGFTRRWDFAYSRQMFALAPSRLGDIVRILVPEGWRIEAEGRAFRPAQRMRSEVRSGIDWFELHGTVDFGDGRLVELPRLLEAIKKGRTSVTLDDGTEGMVPEEWLQRWVGVASAGQTTGDHVRFTMAQAALLDAALASQPAVSVDAHFAQIREELATLKGVEPLDPAGSFAGQLRDYQRDALGWFAFLRRFGFGGCLADDMGLGKTVMVLAWLDRLRARREAKGPSLVVVPRSVVFNWIEETARFAPKLRVLDFSGSDRDVADLASYDIVLTTYGTLRRDALLLKDVEFEYAVLDEAQTIKNSNTASAKAARLLRARHRLALSGTPIENHLGELWSLFEFLNPGLLGSSTAFSRHGVTAARRDPDAMDVLSRGVRPFILRRTKAEVAPELPQRSELTIKCELGPAQRDLYDELRQHYRATLLGRIDRDGLKKSKMQVLEALLRLRQAACHPGLVDPRRAQSPSAKFDALLPQLLEVREEGHKCLVFSQFTSLLALLRRRLDEASIVYEYLDGRTRDRQERVERFQTDPACGLFLISLKAGGLGLNLTAAEYVFLLDPWWNPAVEAQAIDRAHRIGQTRHVFAYRLLATNTVEEKIAELQASKRDLAEAILQADSGLLRQLSREDVEVLLG